MIRGYVGLLRGAEVSESEREEFLAVIEGSCEVLLTIGENLAAFRMIEEGRLALGRSAIDLAELLDGALRRWTPRAREQGVEVAPLSSCAASLKGDAHRIEQLFDELLSNAVKFTPARERIAVKLSCDHGQAVVEIVNSGAYIADSELAQIFEPFYRGASAAAAEAPGAGLGLWIGKAIVAAHAGTIEAASDRETGARFRVALPLTD